MTPPLDFRDLLKKYMTHVGEQEGSTYVDRLHRPEFAGYVTDEELAELEEIEDELMEGDAP